MSKRAYICGPEHDNKYSDANSWAIVKPRKRRSRWSQLDNDKTYVPGMPTQLPPDLTPQQEKMYILQLQIEDISRRLKTGDLGIPTNPEDRSPSPDDMFTSDGKRLNTREYRLRKKMEEDRQTYIQMLLEMNPEYKPPMDYRTMNKLTDKVFIPQDNHPNINFVGLLIGPRGNTLKALEKETGAKIIIRGKGSIKDGKLGRNDGMPLPGEDEPLHAYISAATVETCQFAVKKVTDIIRQGIELPECENDLRKSQLRELALLNGTLEEHEGLARLRAIAASQNIATNRMICCFCGGYGHLMSDCKFTSAYNAMEQLGINPEERSKMDNEYSALMAELSAGYGGATGFPASMALASAAQLQMRPMGGVQPSKQPAPPGVSLPEDDTSEKTVTSVSSEIPSVPMISPISAPLTPAVPQWPIGITHPQNLVPSALPASVPFNQPQFSLQFPSTAASWMSSTATPAWYMPQTGAWNENGVSNNVAASSQAPFYGTTSGYLSGVVQRTSSASTPPPPGL